MMKESLVNYMKMSKKIYQKLLDEQSRYIFKERLLYLMSGDSCHVRNMIKSNIEGIELCKLLDEKDDVYIFGAGTWGKDIVQVWPGRWKGFLDNNSEKWGKHISDVKIYPPEEIITQNFSGKILISSRVHFEEIKSNLLELGMDEHNIINVGYMLNELAKKQYFSLAELPHSKNEVFVDVGGLDAQTALEFVRWSGEFEKIFCFEPDINNAIKCKKNLDIYIKENRAKIIEKGAWSMETKLNFSMNGDGTSSIEEEGEIIEVTTLDSMLKDEGVTFIKMDIEGAEYQALLGASEIIKERKPKLAISIYHKPEDIIMLPALILEYNPEYKLYLRHYSLASAETILYAI